ncbi:phage tail protein [Streptococcus suis]|uniref:phage tail spike protein n=1 Tax=Streptococcus suis TaxID=1307 RepID=UPI0021195ACF|nr:phage tail protein [Streptococcus suis]
MIYLFDKDEKLIKIVRKSAVKTALQKYALTTERYVSDRLTVELKGLNADELEQVEYMAIQTIEDAHTFHYFYVAQKFSDSLTTLIGVQSGIEELRKSPVFDKRPKNALARDVIADLLAGTNWQARFVGETTAHSTNFYYTSIFDALKKVCEVWDLEMQFFVEMNGNQIGARYIDFKQRIGEAVGKRVVYGHNALQILQEVERTNIFTALVGRGKGEETGDGYGRKITFEDVVWSRTQGKPVNKPKGQKYLELPLMTRQYGIKNADGSMRPKIGFVDFSEEENPEILIERTYRALIDAARPQLTLKTSSVYLRGVKVGDTIRVVRHDKKLDYDTRIFEITFNRLNNQSSDIKLGDRIGESNEAKVQTIADKAVEQFVNNEFSNFVQNLPDYLPSADGFNNNWYGTEDPTVQYPGKVLINDIWFKPDSEHEGHKIMLRWTGEVWEEILRTYDSEALRDRIAEEIAQVNQSMQAQAQEHDRQVADILSKTQSVESLANQAKSDAASALARANQVKTEAIAEATRLDTVERQATETKLATAKSQAISEATRLVETAKTLLSGQISNVSTDLSQTKETIKLLATRATVEALTGRISSAESTLQVQAGEIASRVKSSDFDQAKQRISTAESSITQLGSRITTEISEVEGKIPTEIGGRNYILKSQAEISSAGRWSNKTFKLSSDLLSNLSKIKTVTISCDVEGRNVTEFNNRKRYGLACSVEINGVVNYWEVWQAEDTSKKRISQTFTVPEGKTITKFYSPTLWIQADGNVKVSNPKIEFGRIPTDYTLAPEDLADEISLVKTTITQTASGVEQLSTSLTTTDSKVTTAETKISQLISDVSSKVSQTDYNTLTGRVDSAETAITQNAQEISKRLTSTQIESAITSKGYQTKAQVDNNITGRGYITNSALQPYALATTVQNLVQETADSFSRTISETKSLIPTEVGGRNYLLNSKTEISGGWGSKVISLSPELLDNLNKIKSVTISCDVEGTNVSTINSRKRYGLACSVEINGVVNYWEVWQAEDTSKKRISQTFTVPEGKTITKFYSPTLWIQADGNVKVSNPKIEFGVLSTDWSPALEDLATVTALHSVRDTVDSHTRTISTINGTVSTLVQTAAGLVTEVSGTNGLKTQVSTLAGSWAVKNLTNSGTVLNQLNLNKDGSVKIDGKLVQITGTTYIQDGVITSAKIGKGQIGTAHIGEIDAGIAKIINLDVSNIKGLDAEFIKAKIENAFIEWMKGKTITAVNDATTFDLATGVITVNNNQSGFVFKDGNSVVGRIGYGNITQLGTGLGKGIDIYTSKNSTITLGYELSTGGVYSTAIQVNGGTGNVIIPTSLRLTSGKLYPNFYGDEYLRIGGDSDGVSIGLGGAFVSIRFTSDDIIFQAGARRASLSQLLSRG